MSDDPQQQPAEPSGDAPSQQQIEQISDALAAGRKIEAIKIYREATGKGLKEAKDFIDALLPQLKAQDPERYANVDAAKGAGCGAAVLGLAGMILPVAAIVACWLFG